MGTAGSDKRLLAFGSRISQSKEKAVTFQNECRWSTLVCCMRMFLEPSSMFRIFGKSEARKSRFCSARYAKNKKVNSKIFAHDAGAILDSLFFVAQ